MQPKAAADNCSGGWGKERKIETVAEYEIVWY